MSLLLRKSGLGNLGMSENSDDGTVFLDSFKFSGDRSTRVLSMFECIFGESLLLGSVP